MEGEEEGISAVNATVTATCSLALHKSNFIASIFVSDWTLCVNKLRVETP